MLTDVMPMMYIEDVGLDVVHGFPLWEMLWPQYITKYGRWNTAVAGVKAT